MVDVLANPEVLSLKAVADPVRLRILHMLFHQKELCVCQFAAVLRVSYTSLSRHLQILKQAGLVTDDRRGRWVYYAIDRQSWNPSAKAVLACVRRLTTGQPYVTDLLDTERVVCCKLDDVASLGPAFFDRMQNGRKPRAAC
jgi:DNA-binding transcriptional ArsR family regulator